MKKYNYIIKGAYGTGNFGDDALLDVILDKLPKSSKIAVITKEVNYLKKMHPNIACYTVLDNIELQCDNLILGGGTQYFTFPSNSKVWNRFKYHLSHPKYVINRVFGRKLKIKAKYKVGLGLGLGPFLDTNSRQFLNILKSIKEHDRLFVRDYKSLDFCNEYNIKNVSLCTDLCFMRDIKNRTKKTDCNKGAIILRDWIHDDYGQKHFYAIKKFILNNKDKYDLVLFANDKYWISFAEENKINHLLWKPEENAVNDFISKLDQYKFFISSRFHGMVYSTLLGKPSIAIDIEPKLTIGSNLNCGLLWRSDDDIDRLNFLISDLERNFERYSLIVKEKLNKEKIKSKDIETFIKDKLVGKHSEV